MGNVINTGIFRNPISLIIICIGVLFTVLLILREFRCWYWKVNELLQEIREVNKNLRKIDRSINQINQASDISTNPESTNVKNIDEEDIAGYSNIKSNSIKEDFQYETVSDKIISALKKKIF